jgi:outer membrane lipoprotein carrier protein
LVKKPGKMRWTYTSPEEKVFVSDGVKLYSHIPRDRQVIVSSVPGEDEASTPALFLTGKGSLLRDFTAAYTEVPGAPAGAYALTFTPREPQREYEWLTLVVDPGTLKLLMLVTADRQGGRSTFTFTNLKENVGLSDKVFAFTIPRGTDVITDTSLSR